ncbi:MAG: uracil-DNA glycosylase [Gemmatimonadetes bacterium]|nr:uracil-DNA glycosylase [Gemmatimonadota bacterium]
MGNDPGATGAPGGADRTGGAVAPQKGHVSPPTSDRKPAPPVTAPNDPSPGLASLGPGLSVGPPLGTLESAPAWHSLDDIARAVASCTLCPLYAGAKNPVPGHGNPNADFVCVGEAPGANEDEQGLPFVGQAGQLLTKILAAINLSRDDVFICNVLKHRPPGNRNPSPDEVTACSPYLVRQIELLRPKVILALGTFAAQTLLQTKEPIGKLRGRLHRYHGVPVIVTYHPAALLRNPSWKRPTWEDVQLARTLFDRVVEP